MRQKHYTPPLSRFLVCALYHEPKTRGIPMTRLANNLVETALKDSPGWKQAEEAIAGNTNSKPAKPGNHGPKPHHQSPAITGWALLLSTSTPQIKPSTKGKT